MEKVVTLKPLARLVRVLARVIAAVAGVVGTAGGLVLAGIAVPLVGIPWLVAARIRSAASEPEPTPGPSLPFGSILAALQARAGNLRAIVARPTQPTGEDASTAAPPVCGSE